MTPQPHVFATGSGVPPQLVFKKHEPPGQIHNTFAPCYVHLMPALSLNCIRQLSTLGLYYMHLLCLQSQASFNHKGFLVMVLGHPPSSAHPSSRKTVEARYPQCDPSFHSLIVSPTSAFCHARQAGSLSSSLRTCPLHLPHRCSRRTAIAVSEEGFKRHRTGSDARQESH